MLETSCSRGWYPYHTRLRLGVVKENRRTASGPARKMIQSATIFEMNDRKNGAHASVRKTGLAEGAVGAKAAGGAKRKAGRIAPVRPLGDACEECRGKITHNLWVGKSEEESYFDREGAVCADRAAPPSCRRRRFERRKRKLHRISWGSLENRSPTPQAEGASISVGAILKKR